MNKIKISRYRFVKMSVLFISLLFFILIALTSLNCNKNAGSVDDRDLSFAAVKKTEPVVTFIELGSVNCIPCRMMQPVMKNIEKKYSGQVKVIFYDVWTQQQKQYAQLYKIRVIPTQVFLDENGKEFHRHEGFYPEAEIDKVLQTKGIKPKG